MLGVNKKRGGYCSRFERSRFCTQDLKYSVYCFLSSRCPISISISQVSSTIYLPDLNKDEDGAGLGPSNGDRAIFSRLISCRRWFYTPCRQGRESVAILGFVNDFVNVVVRAVRVSTFLGL